MYILLWAYICVQVQKIVKLLGMQALSSSMIDVDIEKLFIQSSINAIDINIVAIYIYLHVEMQ